MIKWFDRIDRNDRVIAPQLNFPEERHFHV
jgi:hypothetical protein